MIVHNNRRSASVEWGLALFHICGCFKAAFSVYIQDILDLSLGCNLIRGANAKAFQRCYTEQDSEDGSGW